MPIFPEFGIRLPGIFSAKGAIISAQQPVRGFGTLIDPSAGYVHLASTVIRFAAEVAPLGRTSAI